MILGIGIDSVMIDRFAAFEKKSLAQLQRMYSKEEIAYCMQQSPLFTKQRFAGRFAAREAAYKALAHIWSVRPPLLTFCKYCTVGKTPEGLPTFSICWEQLLPYMPYLPTNVQIFLSLTYTTHTATAVVLVQKI